MLASEDVVTGNWDKGTRVFTPGGSPFDAVRVIIQRSQANGNAVELFFAQALGFDEVDLTASAIAVKVPPDACFTNGIVAGNQVLASSTEQVLDSFCVYGRNGVKVGSNNTFAPGTQVGMLDLNDLQSGSNNDDLDDALVEMDLAPSEATDETSLIAGLQADLPDYITQTDFVSVLPDPPVAGTAYIVDGDVNIDSDTTRNDVVIVSTKKITTGSGGAFANVILAASDNVEIGSNTTVGASGYCTGSGDGSVQFLAVNHVKIGSNTAFSGAQIIAGQEADLGSNQISATALAIQAGNDVKLGSNLTFGVCDGPSEHARFSRNKISLEVAAEAGIRFQIVAWCRAAIAKTATCRCPRSFRESAGSSCSRRLTGSRGGLFHADPSGGEKRSPPDAAASFHGFDRASGFYWDRSGDPAFAPRPRAR